MAQLAPSDSSGAFVRSPSAFRHSIAAPDADHPDPPPSASSPSLEEFPAPSPGRYALYAALSCPWAHRTLIVHRLKGLEAAVPLVVAQPGSGGLWEFPARGGGGVQAEGVGGRGTTGGTVNGGGEVGLAPTPDSVNGCRTLREVYGRQRGGYDGRCTVPMLWDAEQRRVVNNESADIIRLLNRCFNRWAQRPSLDLEPAALRRQMQAWDEEIYSAVNNGVYKCGFATSQAAYSSAAAALFACLARLDAHLAAQRFLCSRQQPTLSDVRLFTTLLRFDAVYLPLFRCTQRSVSEHPHLYRFMQDMYQLPGVAETCSLPAIMADYYGRLFPLNPSNIVPQCPASVTREELMRLHGREALAAE